MRKYSLFGGGEVARKAIVFIGKDNIDCIYDNNVQKWGQELEGIEIRKPPVSREEIAERTIVVSVSLKYQDEILSQLEVCGIHNYTTVQEIMIGITKERIAKRKDYIEVYQKAIQWIETNTIDGNSIICNSKLRKGYPEVTGYYIPSLVRWGYRDLAIAYAYWLCSIQKDDGSWYDTYDRAPYIFDSAQVLKGLIAIYPYLPSVKENILKGCDWILSNMDEDGRLVTPTKDAWGRPGMCSELIHLYCLSPIYAAANLFEKPEYRIAADRTLKYYKDNHYNEIMDFGFLSHFYAYVMEALLDVGETEMAREAMEKVALLQKESGAVPAYKDVDWVCSTGLFQLALVWYRLGEVERGNKAFYYACDLQNESGGWFGSYMSEDSLMQENDYFPTEEISWANKYFLDALYYKGQAEFNLWADSILPSIEYEDERYRTISTEVGRISDGNGKKILDVGCGKGRYLYNLLKDYPENQYYGIDLSDNVLRYITKPEISKKEGSLTNIGYENNQFDLTYSCEALEHAIDVRSAIREMARVTKPGGTIVVIDKNRDEYGRFEIKDWEVWFGLEALKSLMEEFCSEVKVLKQLNYESKIDDNLFAAWIGTVK